MKKNLCIFIFMVFLLLPLKAQAQSNITSISTTSTAIGMRYLSGTDIRTKVRVASGSINYDYDLFGRKNYEYFPLQLGKGDYIITIFENIIDSKYRITETQSFKDIVNNLMDVFKASIQTVNWNKDMLVIKKAKELVLNKKTDKDKVSAIYTYIVGTFKYDYNKINGLKSTYVPNIELIYKDKKGICYDYAAVFAAMCRSQNIPTKLIKGYTTVVKEYHAWNEIFINNSWQVIDTTFDSVYKAAGRKTTMYKDKKLYTKSKEY